jgi:hypothetical protein
MVTMRRIGFIVEGDLDRSIVEPLALRLLAGKPFAPQFIRVGGKAAFSSAYVTALKLLDRRRYEHVIVLFDADTIEPADIEWQREHIEQTLRQHQLGPEDVSVCVAVPAIEAWLLTRYLENPESLADAKEALARQLAGTRVTPSVAARLAEELDLELARRRATSFRQFADTLDFVTRREDRPWVPETPPTLNEPG